MERVDIEGLINQIRKDLGLTDKEDNNNPGNPLNLGELPIWHCRVNPGKAMDWEQLRGLEDREFITTLYRLVLRRSPDEEGEKHYISLLNRGVSRAELCLRLRYSKEGRYQRVPVKQPMRLLKEALKARLYNLFGKGPGHRKQMRQADQATDPGINEQLLNLEKVLRIYRRRILELDSRITELSNRLDESPNLNDRPMDDATYRAFEEHFRGPKEVVKNGLITYLPEVRKLDTISSRTPLLDLGCGRGEWLELLREEGIPACGIDINPGFAAAGHDRGLAIEHGEVLTHLAGLADHSRGALSAFHLIEHLHFSKLLRLLDEAARVLRPGGLLLLETPNPENLQVAAHRFYIDPSHQKPLPPDALSYFVAQAGFGDITIRRRNPDSLHAPKDLTSPTDKVIHDCIFGPQDYALLAYNRADAARPSNRNKHSRTAN